MGNTLSQWRATIGCWCGGVWKVSRATITKCTQRSTASLCPPWFKLLVVAILLVIAGVETNPGPREHEVAISRYKKTSGSAQISGQLYEVNMSALLFLRAFNKRQKFSIASNMDAATPFDDIVFTLGPETAFIQLKHKDNKKSKIYMSQLFQFKRDVNVLKYYKFYLHMKECWNKNEYFKSCGRFEDCRFIVFTNAILDGGVEINLSGSNMHDIINTEGKCICFRKEVNQDIYETFNSLLRYKQVLAEAVFSKTVEATTELIQIIRKLHNANVSEMSGKEELQQMLEKLDELGELTYYQEFLSQLYFYTEQKSEKDLNILIKNELSNICGTHADFHNFILGTQNWWKNSNVYLTESIQFWQEILISRVDSVCKQIPDIGLKFSDGECHAMRLKLSSARKMYLKTYCNQLSILKVLQSLDTKFLVDFRTLKTRLNEVLAVWSLGAAGNVLLVDGWTDCEDVIAKIDRILDKYLDRKLVVIMKVDVNCNDTVSLSQLDQESQNIILDKQVNFQGFLVSLKNLADTATLLESVNADIMMKLLSTDGVLEVGHKAADHDPYYIKRTLLRKEYISKKIISDSHIKLAISGLSVPVMEQLTSLGKEVMKFGKDRFLESNNAHIFIINDIEDFDELCKFNKEIHWIQEENGKFIWKKSFGHLKFIEKYIRDIMNNHDIRNIYNLKQNVVLVIGEPGMGKSTEMSYLNHILKKENKFLWVVLIDLSKHSHIFNQDQPDISNLLMAAGKFETDFERCLMEYNLNVGTNITLIFDGFDNVLPEYKDKVLGMLKSLLNRNIKNIWVTSRPFTKEMLERELCTRSFTFQELSNEDEKELLSKILMHSDEKTCDLSDFISKLLISLRKSLNDKLERFTRFPLHVKLVADIFKDNARKFRETGTTDFENKLDSLTIYDKYIDFKWKMYFEKYKIDTTIPRVSSDYRSLKKKFQRDLMGCALVSFLDKEHLEMLHNKCDIAHNNQEFVESFEKGEERSEIVVDVIYGQVRFVHITLTEYFVALWFSENFSYDKKCLASLYFDKKFQTVRNFFDRILSRTHKLHIAVLNEDTDSVRQLLQKNHSVNDIDKGSRTALHLAITNFIDKDSDVENDLSIEIINILLEHNADFNIEDEILCLRPLRLAAKIGAYSAVDLLLGWKANKSDLNEISQNLKTPEFVQNILPKAASQGYINLLDFILKSGINVDLEIGTGTEKYTTSMLHIALECKQFQMVKYLIKNKADIDKQDSLLQTPLVCAIQRGMMDIAVFLIQHGANVNIVNNTSKTPLMLVVEKCIVEFIEYLLTQTDDTEHTVKRSQTSDKIITYLINNGAYVNCKNNKGQTPLLLAIATATEEMGKSLVKMSDVYHKNKEYKIQLISRTQIFLLKIVDHLIYHKADVNIPNDKQEIPLVLAVKAGLFKVADFLLQKGSDINYRNDKSVTPLMLAAKEGNLKSMKYLIRNKADVNVIDENCSSAFLYAAKFGHKDAMELLQEHDATITIIDKDGNTALHNAVSSKSLECVKYLLLLGIGYKFKNKICNTPLILAAKTGELEIIDCLVKHNADINCSNYRGETPLMMSVEKGLVKIVDYFIKNGAQVHCSNDRGETPLMIAAQKGELEIIDCLVKHNVDINCSNYRGETPLMMSVEKGLVEIVDYFIKKGAQVHCSNDRGETPLMIAAQKGELEIIDCLVKHNADINCSNYRGETPLMMSVEKGLVEIVDYFIKKGAQVHCSNDRGETPSMIAAQKGELEIIDCLVKHNADINCSNYRGETPLMMSVEKGLVEIVDYFIKKGAQVHCSNDRGETPLMIAAQKGELEIIDCLVKHNADINCSNYRGETPLMMSVEKGLVEIVDYFIKKGAQVHCSNDRGETPLMIAAKKGPVEVVKYILEQEDPNWINKVFRALPGLAKLNNNFQAKVNIRDKSGTTAFLHAAKYGHVNIMKLLNTHGADLNARDNEQNTALHNAVASECLECVKYLINCKLNIKSKNRMGKTPLMLAKEINATEIVHYLESQKEVGSRIFNFFLKNVEPS